MFSPSEPLLFFPLLPLANSLYKIKFISYHLDVIEGEVHLLLSKDGLPQSSPGKEELKAPLVEAFESLRVHHIY